MSIYEYIIYIVKQFYDKEQPNTRHILARTCIRLHTISNLPSTESANATTRCRHDTGRESVVETIGIANRHDGLSDLQILRCTHKQRSREILETVEFQNSNVLFRSHADYLGIGRFDHVG